MAKPSKAPGTESCYGHMILTEMLQFKKKKKGIQVAGIPSAIAYTKHQESTPVKPAKLSVSGQKMEMKGAFSQILANTLGITEVNTFRMSQQLGHVNRESLMQMSVNIRLAIRRYQSIQPEDRAKQLSHQQAGQTAFSIEIKHKVNTVILLPHLEHRPLPSASAPSSGSQGHRWVNFRNSHQGSVPSPTRLPAILSTALSAGSSTEPPWIFLFDLSCLGKFQGKVSPGAGDAEPDFWLKSSSSEKSAEEDIEQR